MSPEEKQFALNFSSAEVFWSADEVYVPIPMAELTDKQSVTIHELARLALHIPEEFVEARQAVAVALDRLESGEARQLTVYGPVEGDCYIGLPSPQSEE